jgi:hypothetical protein
VRRPRERSSAAKVRTGPSSDHAHDVVYFRRYRDDDPEHSIPGRDFLNHVCPTKFRATMRADLGAVPAAPPKRYAGGGYWEAMMRT